MQALHNTTSEYFTWGCRHMPKRLVFFIGLLVMASQSALAVSSPINVTLQLNWLHQFEFAGYYAALHKGFYKDAGLEVTLKEGSPNISPIDEVTQGRADFGVSSSGLVKSYLEGKPVIVLAPIFQHSPEVLLSLDPKIKTPSDVARAGAIGLQPGDESLDLKAMFVNEGIALDKLKIDTEANGLKDLLAGKIVAMNAYLSNEPFILQKRGIAYRVIDPNQYGMDFYNGVLFTSRTAEKAQPEVVSAFRRATLKGWEYALAHQDEVIGLILAGYNTQEKSRDYLIFEAKTLADLIGADVIQIGHSNPGRWRHIVETYAKFGIIKFNYSLDGFFCDPNPPPPDMTWLYRLLAATLLVGSVVAAIAVYIHRINRKLQTTQAHLVDSERRADAGQQRALEALAAQQQFIAMVSHEFRSPLAVIDISAQLLAKKPVVQTDSKAATLVTRIRRGTVRLAQFLDTCLTQDRLRDTGLLLKPAALDLAALAGAASEGAQLLADHHRIVTEVQPDLPPLQGDAELLRILLANLLSNAVKYSSPASEIRLRVTNVGDRHILEIIDHGCGIPADEVSHIFEKYRRGRLAAGTPGAGLGLALCWQIVQLHGGHIHVDSTQGVGTRVVVEFPAESSADAQTSQFADLPPT